MKSQVNVLPKKCNRAGWPAGPWDSEPDYEGWISTGERGDDYPLRCEIWRMPDLGHLCGYVIVPAGHPWCGLGCLGEPAPVDVHGGITFARAPTHGDGWVLGFDCAHAGDFYPADHVQRAYSRSGVYRDCAYVRAECEKLAQQVREQLDAIERAGIPQRTPSVGEAWEPGI